MPEFVAVNHRFHQVFTFCDKIEHDRADMNRDENHEHFLIQLVNACQPVTGFLADQIVQRALGKNVVIGK